MENKNDFDRMCEFLDVDPDLLQSEKYDIICDEDGHIMGTITSDNIDEYQKKAHEILQANKAFNDFYSQFFELEQGRGDYIFEQTVNTLQNLKPFMFGRTVGVLDENNDDIIAFAYMYDFTDCY